MCWLSGRDLFERFGGEVPVGLAMNAVGAHPIESWLGPDQLEACGIQTFNHGTFERLPFFALFRGEMFGPFKVFFPWSVFGPCVFLCSALFPWSRSS